MAYTMSVHLSVQHNCSVQHIVLVQRYWQETLANTSKLFIRYHIFSTLRPRLSFMSISTHRGSCYMQICKDTPFIAKVNIIRLEFKRLFFALSTNIWSANTHTYTTNQTSLAHGGAFTTELHHIQTEQMLRGRKTRTGQAEK